MPLRSRSINFGVGCWTDAGMELSGLLCFEVRGGGRMKPFIPAVIILAISGFVYGQNTPATGTPGFINLGRLKPDNKPHVFSGPEEFHVVMVRRKMLQSNPNPTTGSPQLHRMGDEAAVNIMKVLGEGVPLSDTNEFTILDMIHTAFEFPEAIMVPFDRHPDATSFLLR